MQTGTVLKLNRPQPPPTRKEEIMKRELVDQGLMYALAGLVVLALIPIIKIMV